ncbi:cupin domain-containing protein [Ideonella dechloratans]|uniref:cupin domain-containing protein n=1 Tax=Ideonella dechloratans TaxID=36863 RepID=UPI0035B0D1EE
MQVRADLSQRVVLRPQDMDWVDSPQPGVQRVLLDRIGGEVARATSLVRYAPGAFFPVHHHGGGEEILVLDGVFQEGDAAWAAGLYLRNPPGSSHQPRSDAGTRLFVKLGQMPQDDGVTVRVDTRAGVGWRPGEGGLVRPLHRTAHEQVDLLRLPAGRAVLADPTGGSEWLVLVGRLRLAGELLPCESWLRLPPGDAPALQAGPEGVTLYRKTGHLARPLGLEPAC